MVIYVFDFLSLMIGALDELTAQAEIAFPRPVTLPELEDFLDHLSRQPGIEVEYSVRTTVRLGNEDAPSEGGRRTTTVVDTGSISARLTVGEGEGSQVVIRRSHFIVPEAREPGHYLGMHFRLDFGSHPEAYPAGEREVWDLVRRHVDAYQRFD